MAIMGGWKWRRSEAGAQRQVDNAIESTPHIKDLKVRMSLWNLAEQIRPPCIRDMPSDKLKAILEGLDSLSPNEWHDTVKKDLLSRRITEHIQDNLHSKIITVCDPFGEEPFHPHRPTIKSCEDDAAARLHHFNKVMFRMVIPKFIEKGVAGEIECNKCCRLCMDRFDALDRVDMSSEESQVLNIASQIWMTLLAILDADYYHKKLQAWCVHRLKSNR